MNFFAFFLGCLFGSKTSITVSESKIEVPRTGDFSVLSLKDIYDIRIKEVHHYNTVIWAFPLAYALLLVNEIHYLEFSSPGLVAGAIFNIFLTYIFICHLKNKAAVQTCLRIVEEKVKVLCEEEMIPTFPPSQPKATDVMQWTIIVSTGVFLGYSIYPFFPPWK